MRISSVFVLVCLLTASGAKLLGQTAVEYGTVTAGSTAGATSDPGDISRSIRSVFGRLGKMGDDSSKGQQGRQTAHAAQAAKPAASGKGRQSAVASNAKPEAPRIVQLSQIRVGMSREELLNAVGKPYMQISGTEEGVFAETYMYRGDVDTVTVTLHGGTVAGVSPMPQKSVTAAAPATPTPTSTEVERPQ